jgi:hypothetical protein
MTSSPLPRELSRQWFPQILGWVRRAGWTVLCTDGTFHQFPFLRGRNPIRWEALESNRAVRKPLRRWPTRTSLRLEKMYRSEYDVENSRSFQARQ